MKGNLIPGTPFFRKCRVIVFGESDGTVYERVSAAVYEDVLYIMDSNTLETLGMYPSGQWLRIEAVNDERDTDQNPTR